MKTIVEVLHETQEQLPELVWLALHGIVEQFRHLGTEIERLAEEAFRRGVVVTEATRWLGVHESLLYRCGG